MSDKSDRIIFSIAAGGETCFETEVSPTQDPESILESSNGLLRPVTPSARPKDAVDAATGLRSEAPTRSETKDDKLRDGLKDLAKQKNVTLDSAQSTFQWIELLLKNGTSVGKLAELGIQTAGNIAERLWNLVQDSKPVYHASDEIGDKASRAILNAAAPTPSDYVYEREASDTVSFVAKDGWGMQLWRVDYRIDVCYRGRYTGHVVGVLPALYVPGVTVTVVKAEVLPGQAVNKSGAKMEREPRRQDVKLNKQDAFATPSFCAKLELFLDGDHKAMGLFPGKHFALSSPYEVSGHLGLVRKF